MRKCATYFSRKQSMASFRQRSYLIVLFYSWRIFLPQLYAFWEKYDERLCIVSKYFDYSENYQQSVLARISTMERVTKTQWDWIDHRTISKVYHSWLYQEFIMRRFFFFFFCCFFGVSSATFVTPSSWTTSGSIFFGWSATRRIFLNSFIAERCRDDYRQDERPKLYELGLSFLKWTKTSDELYYR